MQLDSRYNNRLLNALLDEPRRAVASSPGTDLATVLRYGLAARRRQCKLYAILTALLVGLVMLVIWTDSSAQVTLLLFPAAWLAVFCEQLVANYWVVARQLRRDSFDPTLAPEPTSERLCRTLDKVASWDRGNVSVFPWYSPFLGYGTPINSWSMVINVGQPAPGSTIKPFTVQELNRQLVAAFQAAGIAGLSTEDRLLVNGLDLQFDVDADVKAQVLPNELAAPVPQVDATVLDRLRDEGRGRGRPYLLVRIAGWSGELVLSAFLRLSLIRDRKLLFVEVSYSVLAPVRELYRSADRLSEFPAMRQLLRIAGRAVSQAFVLLWTAPFTLATIALRPVRMFLKNRRDRRVITQERTFNYGALLAPRELASDSRYHRYFQEQDARMYMNVVERKVLEAIKDFLEQHGIDAEELGNGRGGVLNNGILVTGNSTVNAQSMVAGWRAFAMSTLKMTPSPDKGAKIAETGRRG